MRSEIAKAQISSISQFIERSIRLPPGISFVKMHDGTIIHQEDPDDDTQLFVYLENEKKEQDGYCFAAHDNPLLVLKRIEKVADELRKR